jgi:hypothetical protein
MTGYCPRAAGSQQAPAQTLGQHSLPRHRHPPKHSTEIFPCPRLVFPSARLPQPPVLSLLCRKASRLRRSSSTNTSIRTGERYAPAMVNQLQPRVLHLGQEIKVAKKTVQLIAVGETGLVDGGRGDPVSWIGGSRVFPVEVNEMMGSGGGGISKGSTIHSYFVAPSPITVGGRTDW